MQLFQGETLVYEGSGYDFLAAARTPEMASAAYRKLTAGMKPSSGTLRKWHRLLDVKFGIVPE